MSKLSSKFFRLLSIHNPHEFIFIKKAASENIFFQKITRNQTTTTTINHQQYHLAFINKINNNTPAASYYSSNNRIETQTLKMSLDLKKIGQNVVKKVPSMEEVKLETLWSENTVVLSFFRRFGCVFCRQAAKELSILTPILEAHNIKNIAVGLEEFGLEEFLEGKYFNGDLYMDIDKKTYKDIGYKRYGTFGVIMSMFSKTARDAVSKSRAEQLPGNLKGDGLQTGGTLVISKGGSQILMDYRQDNPADHVENDEILRVLGITNPNPEGSTPVPTPTECT